MTGSRIAYGFLFAGLAALWIALLAAPVLSARPETDLWWMMPLMETEIHSRSGFGLFIFLLGPAPLLLGQPILKLYLWLNSSAGGFPIGLLVGLAMGIHVLNAFGVYGLSRGLGFAKRVGAVAGVIYLTMFAHFHAYLWPTAVQHLIAVGTVLALLNLYLSAERKARLGRPFVGRYAAALAVMVFASLQRSALLGLLLTGVYALWGSASLEERKTSFDRWLPGWILSGIYPALSLAAVGDPRFTSFFSHWPLPVGFKVLILWAGGVALLLLIRGAIRLGPSWQAFFQGLAILGIAALMTLSALNDKRQWVFLYNAAVPFAATLAAFLEPVRTALLIPSTEPYHFIPPQVSAWTFLMTAALASAFAAIVPDRRRILPLFAAWYAAGLFYFLQPDSSFPVRIPSRYFIYLSPIFSIFFAAVWGKAGEALSRRARIRPLFREAALIGAVAALCVSNIVAIRLEIFRGRLANTYLLYGDLRGSGEDPFDRSVRDAQQAWDRGDLSRAKDRFRRAAQIRPFFLRYVLSPYRLEDVRWLTGEIDFRQWVEKMGTQHVSWTKELPEWAPSFEPPAPQLRRELADYLVCLLRLSYLEHHLGNEEESRAWLFRMKFLEQDGGRLSLWIREDPRVKSNPELLEFARRLDDPVRFPDPLPWRKDDYGFGLFMLRLLTRW